MVEQIVDKVILNWEIFNIGGNIMLNFLQSFDWVVLNCVNELQVWFSQILGQLKVNGMVFVVNCNGVVFGNNSQVNVCNLLVVVVWISDVQFCDNGLYSFDVSSSVFSDVFGKVVVEQGVCIVIYELISVMCGGGYVLLVGYSVENVGYIEVCKGQVQFVVGDSFVIWCGVGMVINISFIIWGNEIVLCFIVGSMVGSVCNIGLLWVFEGDVMLVGCSVEQVGVVVVSIMFVQCGIVYFLVLVSDVGSSVMFVDGVIMVVLIEDDGKIMVLDMQCDVLIKELVEQDVICVGVCLVIFDNLFQYNDCWDQLWVEIVLGGNIYFSVDLLMVVMGGQIIVDVVVCSYVDDVVCVDVFGVVGVQVLMESNNVQIKVQGNELCDVLDNCDSGKLISSEVWVDCCRLVYVLVGIGGYEGECWYVVGGLLEVGGYFDNQGYLIGEWVVQGGIVLLGGREVIMQGGLCINFVGGSLDVQSGVVWQSWVCGVDGQVYCFDEVLVEMLFDGLYSGYEVKQECWGIIEIFCDLIVFVVQWVDNGYMVGCDVGWLIVFVLIVVLDGKVEIVIFQGVQQNCRLEVVLDGYVQVQMVVVCNVQLYLGCYDGQGCSGVFGLDVCLGDKVLMKMVWLLVVLVNEEWCDMVWLDIVVLSVQQWGWIDLVIVDCICIDGSFWFQVGGQFNLIGSEVELVGDIGIVGGQLLVGNLLDVQGWLMVLLYDGCVCIVIVDGMWIDFFGEWSNVLVVILFDVSGVWMDGGCLSLSNSYDVVVGVEVMVEVEVGVVLDLCGKGCVGKGGSVSLQVNSSVVMIDGSGWV